MNRSHFDIHILGRYSNLNEKKQLHLKSFVPHNTDEYSSNQQGWTPPSKNGPGARLMNIPELLELVLLCLP